MTLINKKIEIRSMPTLLEQRNNLLEEMDNLLKKAKEETRSLTDEESKRFDEIKAEIAKIDKTLKAEEEARSFDKKEPVKKPEEERALAEERAFENYIRGIVEDRADANLTVREIMARLFLHRLQTKLSKKFTTLVRFIN